MITEAVEEMFKAIVKAVPSATIPIRLEYEHEASQGRDDFNGTLYLSRDDQQINGQINDTDGNPIVKFAIHDKA